MFIPQASTSHTVPELPQHDTQYDYGMSNILCLTHSVTPKQN